MNSQAVNNITTVTVWQYDPEIITPLESSAQEAENSAKEAENPAEESANTGQELYIRGIKTIFTNTKEFHFNITEARHKKGNELRPWSSEKARPECLQDYFIEKRARIQTKSLSADLAGRILLLQETQAEVIKCQHFLKNLIANRDFTAAGVHEANAFHFSSPKNSTVPNQQQGRTIYLPLLKASIDEWGTIKFADKAPDFSNKGEKVVIKDEKMVKIIECIQLIQEYTQEKDVLTDEMIKLRTNSQANT